MTRKLYFVKKDEKSLKILSLLIPLGDVGKQIYVMPDVMGSMVQIGACLVAWMAVLMAGCKYHGTDGKVTIAAAMMGTVVASAVVKYLYQRPVYMREIGMLSLTAFLMAGLGLEVAVYAYNWFDKTAVTFAVTSHMAAMLAVIMVAVLAAVIAVVALYKYQRSKGIAADVAMLTIGRRVCLMAAAVAAILVYRYHGFGSKEALAAVRFTETPNMVALALVVAVVGLAVTVYRYQRISEKQSEPGNHHDGGYHKSSEENPASNTASTQLVRSKKEAEIRSDGGEGLQHGNRDSESANYDDGNVTKILRQIRQQYKDHDVQYGRLTETGENVIAIFTNTDMQDGVISETDGIKIMYKNTNTLDEDNETAIEFELNMKEPGLSQKENDEMGRVLRENSDFLWSHHSNLNGIRVSAVRTRDGHASRDNCIVLCCQFKGFLPQGEKEFPKTLSFDNMQFPVDVREVHATMSLAKHPSDKLEPLECGGRIIGSCKANNVVGTIGPFVQLANQETGFLTCAHVIDNNPAFGVVPNYNDLIYQPERSNDHLCGELVKMSFRHSGNRSMDAAVVKITSDSRIPETVKFVFCNKEETLSAAELTFNTGAIGDHQPDSLVWKFGSFSPVVQCKCSAVGHEENITYPQGKVLMKGITKILCQMPHQQGDSGSGVFVKDNDGAMACVGLFFAGKGREGFFFPIRDVLRECGNLELKRYV